MKLVAAVRLLPVPEQADLLRTTLERCNAACEWLAQIAHDTGTRRQYDLHKLAYAEMRASFGLLLRLPCAVSARLPIASRPVTRRHGTASTAMLPSPTTNGSSGSCRARTPYRSGRSPVASAGRRCRGADRSSQHQPAMLLLR